MKRGRNPLSDESKRQKFDFPNVRLYNQLKQNDWSHNVFFNPFEYNGELSDNERDGRCSVNILDELSSDFSCLSLKEEEKDKKMKSFLKKK